jgi:hypothetical protein
MADTHAIVDSLADSPLSVPGRDIRRTELELQRCHHAIQRLEAVCLWRLPVSVKVDEAGSDDEAARVDRASAA